MFTISYSICPWQAFNKHSSLEQKFVNYRAKKFYSVGPKKFSSGASNNKEHSSAAIISSRFPRIGGESYTQSQTTPAPPPHTPSLPHAQPLPGSCNLGPVS
jgi:hypothetical protein